jgi:hypothetical protein
MMITVASFTFGRRPQLQLALSSMPEGVIDGGKVASHLQLMWLAASLAHSFSVHKTNPRNPKI